MAADKGGAIGGAAGGSYYELKAAYDQAFKEWQDLPKNSAERAEKMKEIAAIGARMREAMSTTYKPTASKQPTAKPKKNLKIKGPGKKGRIPSTNQISKVLGRTLSADDLAELVGAQDGATVEIDASDEDQFGEVYVSVEHSSYTANRRIMSDGTISNDSFYVKTEAQGKGLGTKVFYEQVQAAVKHGFTYIETTAEKGPTSNGYYTWPRLGYDTEVVAISKASPVRKKLDSMGVERVSDLMKTLEGRKWWKANGDTIDLRFDLKEGSLSRKALETYVNAKAGKTGRATPVANQGGRGNARLDLGWVGNTRWKWRTNAQKIEVFRQWLEDQVEKKLLSQGQLERLWTERYIKAAYERGRVRGTSQAAKARRAMYTEFIQDSNKARRKLESLVQRNLEDLKGLSSRMATKASRAVADALERGDSPTKLANKLSRVLNIEKKQGMVIARTEMVRAQAEGQLDAMEDRGIRRVTAYVEFRIKDGTACPTCQALNGIVMTVKQARGIIPVHPNCRCAWGTVDDEEDYDTKRNRKRVRRAIRQSRKRG
jgi:SPP1 gp7 family putative phage head morphogenesis protein